MITLDEYMRPLREIGVRFLELHGIDDQGFCTCKNRDRCPDKTAGKHPTVLEATQKASNACKPHHNYGYVTGEGIIGVDIDPRNGGDISLAQLESNYGKLPKTWTVDTGGNGKHYLYKIPYPLRSFVPAAGIDFQGANKYLVGPGSKHFSGKLYEWNEENHPDNTTIAEIPDWLLALAEPPSEGIIVSENEKIPEDHYAYVVQCLNKLNPDCPYITEWIPIGMAMHATGWGQQAFDDFDNWSRKATKVYPGEAELRKKWKSFKPKLKNSEGRGAITPNFIIEQAAKVAEIKVLNNMEAKKPEKKSHIDLEVLGLIKDIKNWLLDFAPRQYEQWAIATAFSIVATVAQCKYLTPSGLSLGLYQILLGYPSQGKDHYLNGAKSILMAVDRRLAMREPGSSQGLRCELFAFNSRVWLADEIQDLFGKLTKSDNPFVQAILKDLKEVYNGPEFLGGSVIKGSASPTIHRPRLSLLGFGTPEEMRKVMTEANVGGGLISRIAQWPLVPPPNIRTVGRANPPQSIVDKLKALMNKSYTLTEKEFDSYNNRCKEILNQSKCPLSDHLTAVFANTCLTFGEGAEDLYKEYRQKTNDYYRKNYMEANAATEDRSAMLAVMFASVHAIGCGKEFIGDHDMTLGIDIATITTARSHVSIADSGDKEIWQKILKCLESGGGTRDRLMITKSTRIPVKLLDEAIFDLQAQGRVMIQNEVGSPITRFEKLLPTSKISLKIS